MTRLPASLARLGTVLAGVVTAWLVAPAVTMAASTDGILAPGTTCDGKSLLAKTVGFDFVSASSDFCSAVGPSISMFIFTALNAILLAMIFVLTFRVFKIFWDALNDMRQADTNKQTVRGEGREQRILQSAVVNAAIALAIGVGGFAFAARGPDLLLALAKSFGSQLCISGCSNMDFLSKYLGVFSGFAGTILNSAAFAALFLGVWVIIMAWYKALSKHGYADMYSGADGAKELAAAKGFKSALVTTAITAGLSIGAYLAIRYGLGIFDSVLTGTKSAIPNI